MRTILVLLFICGLTAILVSFLQQAEDVARWSNGYALFETLGDKNPLSSNEIRIEYRKLFYERHSTKYVFWLGIAISFLSGLGLWFSFRIPIKQNTGLTRRCS